MKKLTEEQKKQRRNLANKKYTDSHKEQIKAYRMAKVLKKWEDAGLEYIPRIKMYSIPHRIYLGVKDGLHLNFEQWGKKLKVKPLYIQGACNALRKRGIHIHPVGTQTGAGHKNVKGYLVDISEKLEDFNEVNHRIQNYLTPQIKRAFSRLEKLLLAHPDQVRLVESEATNLLLLTATTKKEFDNANFKPAHQPVKVRP